MSLRMHVSLSSQFDTILAGFVLHAHIVMQSMGQSSTRILSIKRKRRKEKELLCTYGSFTCEWDTRHDARNNFSGLPHNTRNISNPLLLVSFLGLCFISFKFVDNVVGYVWPSIFGCAKFSSLESPPLMG